MRKKFNPKLNLYFGIAALVLGLIVWSGSPFIAFLVMLAGVLNILGYRKSRTTQKEEVETEPNVAPKFAAPKARSSEENTVKYSINIAWWEKYPGINNLIQLNKVSNEPYDGMTAKEIREELEEYDETVYEYPTINESVTFEDEPDNQYNPEALKILCDGELCGYVPDKNLSRVRGILKNHPDARIELIVTHGSSKFMDYEDIEGKGKVRTEKRKPYAKIEFEYTKKQNKMPPAGTEGNPQ